jgi:hypothetical protein
VPDVEDARLRSVFVIGRRFGCEEESTLSSRKPRREKHYDFAALSGDGWETVWRLGGILRFAKVICRRSKKTGKCSKKPSIAVFA